MEFEPIKCAGCGRFIVRKFFLIKANHESFCEIVLDLED